MPKINFKEFPVYKDFKKTETEKHDLRNQFSDLLFRLGDGMKAHRLCHLISESEGEIEVSDKQVEYLKSFTEKFCTPAIIESFRMVHNQDVK